MNSQIAFPSHREYRFYQGLFATCVANGIQAVNFLGDRFLRQISGIGRDRRAVPALGEQCLRSAGGLSGHRRAARIRLLSAGLCLVLSRCSRSRDHHGFRGCRPQGSLARKKRPADAGGRSFQCRHDDHCSRRQRSVHRRQLLLAAVGYAVGHPRRSGADCSRGPKVIVRTWQCHKVLMPAACCLPRIART